ncbi:diacylglycerol kinase family protein [Streptomyces sp. YIM S03343]
MAEVATFAASDHLLVVIDPAARRTDGESVRIAKDVLSAGAHTKVCLPENASEFARALQRRGSRRPVVVGDDHALIRAVAVLHRQRELAGCVLSVVPVGGSLSLAEALGVPTGAVAAARAVLDGVERRLDLLADDSDGVVLGGVCIPPVSGRVGGGSTVASPSGAGSSSGAGSLSGAATVQQNGHGAHETHGHAFGQGHGHPWLRTTYQSLVRSLGSRPARGSGPAPSVPVHGPARLRVQVDGATIVDLDQPVAEVSVTAGHSGLAQVAVRPCSVGAEAALLLASGQTVTVTGSDFRYRADAAVSGPVRRRTWRVLEGAWGLTVPATS